MLKLRYHTKFKKDYKRAIKRGLNKDLLMEVITKLQNEAFDYTPVSVLSTTTTGTVQYQENFSSEAAKSGFAEGLKNSLDRVADFYMDLADEMVPVVEINAGRQVDIIVISGTTLNVTAKNQVDLNAINKTASQGR